MKKISLETAMIVSAMSILGYCYLKNNPDMMCKAKKIIKDTSKMIYTKMDKED